MKTIRLRQWLQASAVALLLANTSPATAQDDKPQAPPFLGGFLKETRIVYPLRIGDWEAQGEHLYDQPELGASVRYRHRGHADRWIDLYFYPAGVLSPERLQTDTQRLLDELRAAIGQPDYYSEGDFDAPRTFTIALARCDHDSDNDDSTIDSSMIGNSTIQARSAGMRLSRESDAYHSALVLLVRDLYYVKGRHSVEADALSRDETRAQLEAFMTEAVRATHITSSGDCGTDAFPDASAPSRRIRSSPKAAARSASNTARRMATSIPTVARAACVRRWADDDTFFPFEKGDQGFALA